MTSLIIQEAVIYLIVLFVLTYIFGLIPLLKNWQSHHLLYFVSLAAGVLLATTFLHILPELFENHEFEFVCYAVLGGFLFMLILEEFVMIDASAEHQHHCDYHRLGLSAFIGISMHSFFDGVALGSGFMSRELIQPVFFAILIHKLPSSFALASLLKKANWSVKKIVLSLGVFSLIIPVATLLSILFLTHIDKELMTLCFAFAMGSFIYIAMSDFLPEVHRQHQGRFKNLFVFLLGVVLVIVLKSFDVEHSH